MAVNPTHIPAVFAEGGNKNPIQKTLQVGQLPQSFTWTQGTPLITMTPIADGGKAPIGADFNGALNAICANVVHTQNGGKYKWSQEVVDNYGGYPAGAIVQSNDELREYRSLVDNNTQDPNIMTGSVWVVYAGQGSVPNASSTTAGIMRVLNVLNSTEVNSALSAAQGKILSDVMDIIAYSPIPYYGDAPPSGFISMSGQYITQSQYPKLFARYGSTLPNLNDGSFIRGVGGNAALLGVKQGDAIRNITGSIIMDNEPVETATGAFYDGGVAAGRGSQNDTSARKLMFDASRVVPTANENRPKNIAFLYIVKAG